jgi:uridine phosphorylase
MSKKAWYIGCSVEAVGEVAILVGDPARIVRLSRHLERPAFPEEQRGLRTVTGWRGERRITATAFGMGAPIATVVLHELADLGVRCFLRIGTAMVGPPASLGDFVVADGALRGEGTSASYAPPGYPAVADHDLAAALRSRLSTGRRTWHAGVFATHDGFYTRMFALDETRRAEIERQRAEMQRFGILATDMETAALLVAGRVLGAAVGSLCIGTVDAMTQAKLDAAQTAAAEADMFEVALDTLAGLPAAS